MSGIGNVGADELRLRAPEFAKREQVEETSDGAFDFGAILADGIKSANDLQNEASAKVDALAAGKSDDLHGAMITSKEADISLKLVGTVRNRLLDAFHELWRINL